MIVLYAIRNRIQNLYLKNPKIHISVSSNRQKANADNQEATITKVYPNFFQIEMQGKHYSVLYKDILTNNIRIVELDSAYTE